MQAWKYFTRDTWTKQKQGFGDVECLTPGAKALGLEPQHHKQTNENYHHQKPQEAIEQNMFP
jgi:hypothetical protein